MAVAREARANRLGLIRLQSQTLSETFGLAVRKFVRMWSVEQLKSFCLEMRGPDLRHLTIESIAKPAFRPTRKAGDVRMPGFAH